MSSHLRSLKAAFAVPNAAVLVLVVHHVLDAVLVRHHAVWPFFEEHPWFLFTAAVTLTLTAAHVGVFAMIRCGTWPEKSSTRDRLERWDMCLFGLDGAWAGLWVLQLVVQLLLPREHRVYTADVVRILLALYSVQTCLTVPLVHYLFRDWCRRLRVSTGSMSVLGST